MLATLKNCLAIFASNREFVLQTCQVSMLKMSEKFVEPSKNVSSVARKIFGGLLRGSGGMLPQKKFENYVCKTG